jgi:hypothetical protein
MFLALPAQAGDCASPDDCAAIPDNGTKAACGLGILAGYGLYQRSQKQKQKPDPEEGSGASTDESLLFGGGNASGGDQVASTTPPSQGTAPPDGPLGDPGDLKRPAGPPDGPLGE